MSAQQDDNEAVTTEQEKLEDSHAGEEKLESPEKNAESLEVQLEQAQAKATENWDAYLHTKAEMDNLRRRNSKDVENAHKYGIEKFVTELKKDSLCVPVHSRIKPWLSTCKALLFHYRRFCKLKLSVN